MRVPWAARRPNLSVLKEINPECSLEGQILKLRLQYFGHLMRREDSLEKTPMLGKCEGKRRRGRQGMRWLNSVIEATNMNLTQLREAVEDRMAWHALVHGFTKSRTRLNDETMMKHCVTWIAYNYLFFAFWCLLNCPPKFHTSSDHSDHSCMYFSIQYWLSS